MKYDYDVLLYIWLPLTMPNFVYILVTRACRRMILRSTPIFAGLIRSYGVMVRALDLQSRGCVNDFEPISAFHSTTIGPRVNLYDCIVDNFGVIDHDYNSTDIKFVDFGFGLLSVMSTHVL